MWLPSGNIPFRHTIVRETREENMEFHHVMEAAGVVILGLVFYSYTLRWLQPKASLGTRSRQAVTGVAFGVLAVVMMVSRIHVGDGHFIDARAVPLALIGLYEGWLAALLAALVAAGFRLWMGGAGQVAGVVGIAVTALIAALVHAWARRTGGVRARHALTLAAAAFAATFFSFLILGPRGVAMFNALALPFLVMSLVGIGCGAYLFRDVVESRTAEESRREAGELRAITLLARAAAHEINNPLTIVIGGITLIGRHLPPESEDGQWIKRVNDGALRIKDIVAHMNNITQVTEAPTEGVLPPMLDIKRSGKID
jgi:signal transduction histidine kinase